MTDGSAREHIFEDWFDFAAPHMQYGKVPDRSRYRTINRGGDRHGALEWSYSTGPDDDPITRLVGLAIIPDALGLTATIEFWFGARRGDRYVRRPSSALIFRRYEDDWGPVEQRLREAQEMADSLGEADLTQQVPSLLW
ncbi:hypothetical protein [Streptomyces aureus]|uniref:hypothetical protein n=1 Tax=Streptomyces aureus TaxID=193461 RepID=UPI000A88BCE6|nr:hypothetical protein [Streptomyces aureus]